MAKKSKKLGVRMREIMTGLPITLPASATVEEAARKMRDHDVGMLPVVKGQRILGVVTDRDVTVRATANGLSPASTPVTQILSSDIIFCYDFEDVSCAIESFEQAQIRRVLVLNRQKRLVGVLSIGDVAVDLGKQNIAGEILQKVSEPMHS